MTYKQAYDKIIDAYFKDEIEPYNREFCFCGTLGAINLNDFLIHWDTRLYSNVDYYNMEYALLSTIRDLTVGKNESIYINCDRDMVTKHPNYEQVLFEGMSAALDVLKQIHINRGEIIDEPIETFKKRELTSKKQDYAQ